MLDVPPVPMQPVLTHFQGESWHICHNCNRFRHPIAQIKLGRFQFRYFCKQCVPSFEPKPKRPRKQRTPRTPKIVYPSCPLPKLGLGRLMSEVLECLNDEPLSSIEIAHRVKGNASFESMTRIRDAIRRLRAKRLIVTYKPLNPKTPDIHALSTQEQHLKGCAISYGDPLDLAVFKAIDELPGISLQEIALQTGIDRRLIERIVKRLVREDAIVCIQTGRHKRSVTPDRLDEYKQHLYDISPEGRKQRILALLCDRGQLSVKAIADDLEESRAVIEIDIKKLESEGLVITAKEGRCKLCLLTESKN